MLWLIISQTVVIGLLVGTLPFLEREAGWNSHVSLLLAALIPAVISCMLWYQKSRKENFLHLFFSGLKNNEINLTRESISPLRSNSPELASALELFYQKLATAISDIEGSAARLVPMSHELADTYGNFTQKAMMQKQYGNQLSNAVESMAISSHRVKDDSTSILNLVRQSTSEVDECRDKVNDSAKITMILSEQMQRSMEKLQVLAAQGKQIFDVIKLINSIAEQISLLALNATIEAARAGEQGRGFAIVADEVKKLAHHTRNSTAEIHGALQGVQQGIDAMVEELSQGTTITEQAAGQAQAVSHSLSVIEEEIAKIVNFTDTISQSVAEQSELSEQTRQAMNGLVSLNSDALENTKLQGVTREDLLKLSEVLKSKLDVFVLPEHRWNSNLRSAPRYDKENGESLENSADLF
ncbi:MAG: methyl-accepting chemotaxis protein [Gammaproteobacteria bacterium]|nr:methyl-accepting chemotaxis protein [Gammaproteobacteria bacterium]